MTYSVRLHHSKHPYGILLLIFIVALVTISWILLKNQCDKLSCITAYESATWQEQEIYTRTANTYRALYAAPDYRIRIEKKSNLSPSDAVLLIQINTMKISGLFDQARSPYPGVISDRIQCDQAYTPEFKHLKTNHFDITYYHTWLNGRLQTGSCLASDRQYISYHAHVYCKQEQALYHLEFIATPSGTWNDKAHAITKSIACKEPIVRLSGSPYLPLIWR